MKPAVRPTLLCIDTHAGTATRYWPKTGKQRPASFLIQSAKIFKLDGLWQLGGPEGLALLEDFRAGKLDVEPIDEKEYA
jgi:hypothetical protein